MQLSVLVVDDSPTLRWAYIRQFARYGVAVDCASNGKEALLRAKKGAYRLIIMDIEMPEMNGIVAAAELRRWELMGGYRPALIVAVTAGLEEDACLSAGLDLFIRKPLLPEHIEQLLLQSGSLAGPIPVAYQLQPMPA